MFKKLPYFKWYPADAETDETFRAMTDAEVGFYLRLLNSAWINGSVPESLDDIAQLLKRPNGLVRRYWEAVGRCFVPHPTEPHRLINPRQEAEREEAISKSEKAGQSAVRQNKIKVPGFVYLIRRSDGLVKIGSSLDIAQRMAQLRYKYQQTMELVGQLHVQSMGDSELDLQTKYQSKKVTGEWFALSRDDIGQILMGDTKGDTKGDIVPHPALRASESAYVSGVGVRGSSETPTQTQKPLRAREAEKPELGEVLELAPVEEAEVYDESAELWDRFWRAFQATGKPLTIQDRMAAENVWKGYPLEEQRRILPHLGVQIRDNWSGPKFTPKPQRYLSAREWEAVAAERVFPTPPAKESSTQQAMRIFDQRMRERGIRVP